MWTGVWHALASGMFVKWHKIQSNYSPKCTCKRPKTFLKSVPKSVDFRLVKCCKTRSNYGPKCTGKRSHIHINPVLNPCHKLTRINMDVRAYPVQFSYRAGPTMVPMHTDVSRPG